MKRKPRPALRNSGEEQRQFTRRAWFSMALILLALVGLGVRFFWLQVVRHDEFVTRANDNSIHVRFLSPPRGMIFDRNGVVLAENVPAFRLEVVPDQVHAMQALLKSLATVVPLSGDDLRRFGQALKERRSFQSVPLRNRLSEDEIARFAINRWRFPGVEIAPYLRRYYPEGALTASVVGYVGSIDQREAEKLQGTPYADMSQIGKSGIEREYEKLLRGVPGYELVEVNADQRPVRVLERVPPRPGENLYLTLDMHLQKAAYAGLRGRAGAAVAVDPRNGQVLALASSPSYDPNLFVGGISEANYQALLDDPHHPLLNRVTDGTYLPGSTVKPFLAVAGLELGLRTPQYTVDSVGEWHIPGLPPGTRGYRDDVPGGFGVVDLTQAIEMSVNTYFYKLAYDMGINRLTAFMAKFGFGQPSGIDLPHEASGVLPSRAWKAKTLHRPWYLGDTVISGIGQGYWQVTPLQLANALSTLADFGQPHRLHLLLATQDGSGAPIKPVVLPPPGPPVIARRADWQAVMEGMVKVVEGARGTARGLDVGFPYRIAGKTGTAEIFSRTSHVWDTTRTNHQLALRHRALFIGFTPASDPRVAGVAILERAAWGGRDAAPIVRDMFDAWARLRHLPDTPLPGDILPPWAPLSAPAGAASSAPVPPAADLPHAGSVLNRAAATVVGGAP